MAYQAGYSNNATFQKDGAGGATTLNITEWDWAEEVVKLITTHAGSGGVQAVIAGILSGDGTVQANVDIAALPNATAPGIRAGTKGTIVLQTGAATPFSIHVMVTKLNWKSVINGLLTYNFQITLDSTSGSYTQTAA